VYQQYNYIYINVTLDYKISHNGNFFPCPHKRGHFQNCSFFYAVWPFVHTQTQHQVTETELFWKLLPGWRFSKTLVAGLSCRQRNQRFCLVTSEDALLSPPTGNFLRLLIGQHGFTVEIILERRRKNYPCTCGHGLNKLSIDVWFVTWQCLAEIQLFEYLESDGAKIKSPLKLSKLSS